MSVTKMTISNNIVINNNVQINKHEQQQHYSKTTIESSANKNSFIHYGSLIDIFRERAALYGDKVCIRYQEHQQRQPRDNSNSEATSSSLNFETLTFNQVDTISTHFAETLRPEIRTLEYNNIGDNDQNGKAVVGYIMDDPVLSYLILLAILKLEYIVFPISPRNSEPAIVHLLSKTNTVCLIASEKYSTIAQTCFIQHKNQQDRLDCSNENDLLSNSSVQGVKILNNFNKDQILASCSFSRELVEHRGVDKKQIQEQRIPTTVEEQQDETIMIIHTSGTTTFPKPIYQKNRGLMFPILDLLGSYFSNAGLTMDDAVMLTFPLFHLHGIISLFMSVSQGVTTIMFHRLPPLPQDTLSVIDKYGVTVMIVPPIQLEDLAAYIKKQKDDNYNKMEARIDQEFFTTLQQIKYCSYGGASLSIQIGEYLHSIGLNVRNSYGSTETGFIGGSELSKDNKKWYHIQPADVLNPYIIWEPLDKNDPSGAHQLVFTPNYPALGNNIAKRPDGSYETGDLYIKSLSDSNTTWYHVGRMDDTLVMKNGEKTNPIPMENEIKKTDIVRNCLVIGENRECTGVLIELDLDEISKYSPMEMIAQVHKAVKRANTIAPSHSTIMIPKMIHILPLNQTLPVTFKGSVIRKNAIKQFQKEIDQMYRTFIQGDIDNNCDDNASSSSAANGMDKINNRMSSSTPLAFSFSGTSTSGSSTTENNNIQQFLCQSAAEVLQCLPENIDPSVSLFDYGLDSLLAIQLRNIIASQFDNIISSMATNFCFEYPTIDSMFQVLDKKINKPATMHRDQRLPYTEFKNNIEKSDSIKSCEQGDSQLYMEESKKQLQEKRYRETQSILHDYLVRIESDFPIKATTSAPTVFNQSNTNKNKKKQKHAVLLTGASGFVGSFLLESMILSPQIKTIYCVIRSNHNTNEESKIKTEAKWKERLMKAFQNRHHQDSKIDIQHLLFHNKKVVFIHLNLNHPKLGIDDTTYTQLQNEVTMIQCCGWLMDFFQTVQHFERECIRGLYNLMKFAYRDAVNPAIQLHVISSVSATASLAHFLQRPQNTVYVVPECPSPQDPHVSMSMGYAQSKYIVEHLLVYLAEHKNMPCFIERLGQLCGDTRHGTWDTNEQYPMMMQAGVAMKMMPDLSSLITTSAVMSVDWVPVDEAANAILEIMLHHHHLNYNSNTNEITKDQRKIIDSKQWCSKRHDVHKAYKKIWKYLTEWKKSSNKTSYSNKEKHCEEKTSTTTTTTTATIYHIVNPKQISWKDVLNAMAECGIKFDVVQPDIWIDELKKHQDYPAYKLMPYFETHWALSQAVPLVLQEKRPDANLSKRMITWGTEKTVRVAPSLAKATIFNAQLFKKCLSSWYYDTHQ